MILGNDFDYIPDIEPESEDVLDSFIAHNNWRSEVKRTSSGSKEHSVSGKHVCSMVDAIVNGNFIDRRNPVDYRGRYRFETLPSGETIGYRNRHIEFTRENFPILSGIIEVNGFSLQYIYIGESRVWALLDNEKRYVFHVIDSQPYNLSPSQKEGDGRCKFGAYNGRRYHKDLINALDIFVMKVFVSTDCIHPDNIKWME
ncbi:hypothetical protein [Muribaculum intestinale]|uniref:hypothetical protein n=1 Tax=Muribaculum intestinale TaxID=1796646 RepID=UPI0026EA5091|nr:hypothetical protein [Muribaculum intestinale]